MADDVDDAFAGATLCDQCGRESCEDQRRRVRHRQPPRKRPTRRGYGLLSRANAFEVKRGASWNLELHPPSPMPVGLRLRERKTRAVPEPEWRIRNWQPRHSRVLLSAQFKSGKTVLRDNWIRSMVDGY